MWKLLLFRAIVGPKHAQRFFLVGLVFMGFIFYAFVHDAFDGSAGRTIPPGPPAPSAVHR